MFNRLSGATRLFPIIGDPIRYVESPIRRTRTFEARDYNGICVPMQVPADDLDAVMAGLAAARNADGILVTMPHKFTAFALCATSSERTKMLGVVSVIRRNPDRTWHGDMLDGLAFVKAQKDHGAQPEGARVLLVGAGGAGSAIAIALLEARVGEHITTPRTPNAELAHHVGGRNFTPTTVRPCQSAFRQWPSCSLKASGTNVAERLLRSQADPLRDLFARPLAMASARPGARASPFAAVPDAGSQC